MTNIHTYDLARRAYLAGLPLLPRVLGRLTRLLYSCEIPYTADIHPSVRFAHRGLGVVIGHDTVVGPNTKILHNVTIGGRSGVRANPVIGTGVLIGAGAVVLGDIRIGNYAVVAAQALVIRDVPAGATAMGVPAVTRSQRRDVPRTDSLGCP